VEATLDAYPEWKIPCKVIAIIPTADRQKSTVKVRIGFDKLDPRILPEMSVKVAFHETGGGPAAATRAFWFQKCCAKPGRQGYSFCRSEWTRRTPGGHRDGCAR